MAMKTKHLRYVTFILVIVSLLSVTPVFASDGEECTHPEHTIQSLRDCVVHATEMGHIDNQGIANSLLVKLDAAQAAFGRGQTRVAVAKLEAFIHEVEAQAGKHIEAMHAEHMIMHAKEVIQALSH
jgi:hypothetical protein